MVPRSITKRVAILVSVLAATLVAAVLWLRTIPPSDPVYEGRALSGWIEQLSPLHEVEDRVRAQAAVRAIGTNAMPLLLSYISKRDQPLMETLRMKWELWTRRPVSAAPIFLRNEAVLGFKTLGALGHTASPQLRKLMADRELAYDASRALGAMDGPGAFALFIDYLDNPAPEKRSAGAAGLGEMGVGARQAVPGLINIIAEDKNEMVRASAVDASGELGPADTVIPTITAALNKDKSEIVRICAVLALGRFPENTNALKAIEHASANDSSAKVRGVAARALRVHSMLTPKKRDPNNW